MRDEGGFTLVELLVAIVAGIVVAGALMALVQISVRHQTFVADRVAANQRARPMMQNLMNTLHSACVAPSVAPLRSGSTGSEMSVISRRGSSVSPTPNLHVVSYSSNALTERIYPASGGTAPSWTFSGTPTSNRQLMDGVTQTSVGSPATQVPVFRYYAYENGVVSTTPLPTPLSAADAARAVAVTISLEVSPDGKTTGPDANAPIALSDTATFRLSPGAQETSEVSMPCE
jgi:type II secretory pathway pseudopilin PulG